jgi:hypothetical protein
MAYDYSEAPPARDFDLIPTATIATVELRIRPGNAGESGLLKRSKNGDCEMLDCELVVVDGPYVKRKFWENMILAGSSDGHARAADVSRGRLRTILESARGIRPDDMTPTARTARTVELKDFDGMRFIARIGIEKGTPRPDGSGENYPDKNVLAAVITPDKKEWHKVVQTDLPFNGGSATSSPAPAPVPAPINKPSWAS